MAAKLGSSKPQARAAVEAKLLYQNVASHVRQLMRQRKLKSGDELPSERALAGQLGVSHLTVRKGLSLLVDEGLIERRVGLGTFVSSPKPSGAAPVAGKVGLHKIVIAISASRAALPVMEAAIRGVRHVMSQDDYSVEVLGIGPQGCDAKLLEQIARRQPEGLIFHGYLSAQSIEALEAMKIPFVSVGVGVGREGVPHVRTDYDGLFLDLVKEAYRLHHRSLAFVTWGDEHAAEQLAKGQPLPVVDSYRAACRRFNLLSSADRVILLPAIPNRDINLLNTDAMFTLAPLPTCLIVSDELIAAAAMRDLEARQLRIPDDISVMALFDCTPHGHRVPLTAADSDAEMMKLYDTAARLLLELRSPDAAATPRSLERLHRCTVQFKASLGAPRQTP